MSFELVLYAFFIDKIFGEFNFISNIPRVAKKTSDKGTYFKPTKDYILASAKNISLLNPPAKIVKAGLFSYTSKNKLDA